MAAERVPVVAMAVSSRNCARPFARRGASMTWWSAVVHVMTTSALAIARAASLLATGSSAWLAANFAARPDGEYTRTAGPAPHVRIEGESNRCPAARADSRFVPHLTRNGRGALKESLQLGRRGMFGTCLLKRSPNLARNLSLAHHDRFEPGCHGEEVLGDRVCLHNVKIGYEFWEGEFCELCHREHARVQSVVREPCDRAGRDRSVSRPGRNINVYLEPVTR